MTSSRDDDYIIKELSIIKNNSIRKRLSKEINSLIDKNDLFFMEIDYTDKDVQNSQHFPYSIKLYEISSSKIM